MNDNINDIGVVEEWCRPSLPTDIVAQGADSTRHARERCGDTRGVDGTWQVNAGPVIPPGGEGGEEEDEDDPIDGDGGGSDNPFRPPDGIWEQRRRQQLRRRRPYIMVTKS